MFRSLFKPRYISSVYKPFQFKAYPQISLHYTYKNSFSVIQDNEDGSKILEEVEAKVLQVIKGRLPAGTDTISRSATFEELGFDSLDMIDMVVSMEEVFRIDIEDKEAVGISTVNDAIAIFHRYMFEKFNRNKLARRKKEKGLVVKPGHEQEEP